MEKKADLFKILNLFNENADIAERKFEINGEKISLYFIDCLINKQNVNINGYKNGNILDLIKLIKTL